MIDSLMHLIIEGFPSLIEITAFKSITMDII
jgi:hypothetical protein